MANDTEARLQDVFRAVFSLAPKADVTRVRQVNHPDWDSLAHVTLIAALESEFGIAVDVTASLELTSYDAIALYLEEQKL